jgi:C-terminal processing protease CtpA/Prc
MKRLMWQIAGCTSILAATATYSAAQTASASGSAQASAESGSIQGTAQAGAGTSSKDDASQQNQSSSSASSNQNTTQNSNNQSNQRSNRDNLNTSERTTSDRSSTNRSDVENRRGSQYSNDRDRDSRNTSYRDRSDRNSSRGGDSRHNMRGPDIGIWFGRNSGNGLIIVDVSSKGAIAQYGFHEGDRIVSVNGHRVTTEADFIQYVLHSDVDRVKIIVVRDGREQIIYVEPAALTREYEAVDTQVDPLERFGIIVDDRYDDRIVVWRVIPRSPAYYAGFQPGDVVVNFGGHPYKTRTEFERGASEWKEGEVNVEVRRGEKTRQLSADVPRYDRANARTDRQMNRQDRRTDRNNGNQTQRRGVGILPRNR